MIERSRRSSAPTAEPLEARRLYALFDVLVFSKTDGVRHDSIADGIAMIEQLGGENDFSVTATEDATEFNADNLSQFETVVFLNTTGDFLNDAQQAAFEHYVQGGGGWVGVHAAAEGEPDWAWYRGLVDADVASETPAQHASLFTEIPSHEVVAGLPSTWSVHDELYNFAVSPRLTPLTDVLLDLDETSFTGGTMGPDHPIAWVHPYMGGRAFYIGLGHTSEVYDDPNYRRIVAEGIRYVSGFQPTPDTPEAVATADPVSGTTPLTVHLSSDGSNDRGRDDALTYAWSFSGDAGVVDSTDPDPVHTFTEVGHFTPRLTVTNQAGLTSVDFVDVDVLAPPDPPPVANPDSAITLRDTAVTIDVLANDTDNEDKIDPRFVKFPTQPTHGAVVAAASGLVTYAPGAGFTGVDSFTYTVADQAQDSLPATVTVTVNPPPDEPALELTVDDNLPFAVVNGQKVKGKVFVTVRDFGAQPFADRVTISLVASTDGTIDDRDTVLRGIEKRLSLAPFASSKPIPIKVSQPFSSADGSYRILARATYGTTDPSDTAAGPSAVRVAPPFRDLAAELAPPFPNNVPVNGRGVVRMLLRNEGNATAEGTVKLFFSDYQPTGPAFLHFTQPPPKVKLKPGASKLVKVHVTFNEAVSVHQLKGSITPAESIGDTNPDNDVTQVEEFTAVD